LIMFWQNRKKNEKYKKIRREIKKKCLKK